ncbi:MAG: hypothetical protein J3K34DRAFT_518099 [Monoraphidium minutum]|nr:MAG: hypothetical protein J3K34DRAFT_518099 [Monoraphidium minutum]
MLRASPRAVAQRARPQRSAAPPMLAAAAALALLLCLSSGVQAQGGAGQGEVPSEGAGGAPEVQPAEEGEAGGAGGAGPDAAAAVEAAAANMTQAGDLFVISNVTFDDYYTASAGQPPTDGTDGTDAAGAPPIGGTDGTDAAGQPGAGQPAAEPLSEYAGLVWRDTQIFNGPAIAATGQGPVPPGGAAGAAPLVSAAAALGVASPPNAVAFPAAAEAGGGAAVAVPAARGGANGTFFAPYSAWLTYTQDWSQQARPSVRVLFTAFDFRRPDEFAGQLEVELPLGQPVQVEFPRSFRVGVQRVTIRPDPQAEVTLDSLAAVLPGAAPVTPAGDAGGGGDAGQPTGGDGEALAGGGQRYAPLPWVPSYDLYCGDAARRDTPECLRHRCRTDTTPECDAYIAACQARGWGGDDCTPPCEALENPYADARCTGAAAAQEPPTQEPLAAPVQEPPVAPLPLPPLPPPLPDAAQQGGAADPPGAGPAQPGAEGQAPVTPPLPPPETGGGGGTAPPGGQQSPPPGQGDQGGSTQRYTPLPWVPSYGLYCGDAANRDSPECLRHRCRTATTPECDAYIAACQARGWAGDDCTPPCEALDDPSTDARCRSPSADAPAGELQPAGAGGEQQPAAAGGGQQATAGGAVQPAGGGVDAAAGTGASTVGDLLPWVDAEPGGQQPQPQQPQPQQPQPQQPQPQQPPPQQPPPQQPPLQQPPPQQQPPPEQGGAQGQPDGGPPPSPSPAPRARRKRRRRSPSPAPAAAAEPPPAPPAGGREVRVTFDDIAVGAAGRTAVAYFGGLSWTGADAVLAAALPPALRPGVTSAPVALANAPALPGGGGGGGAVGFAASAFGAGRFTPLSVVLTQEQDPSLAPALGLAPGADGVVYVSCFDAAGGRLGGGAALLPAGVPQRVDFPPDCAGAARVAIAPAASSMRFVLDDLAYIDLT